jgi:hypothetical protein
MATKRIMRTTYLDPAADKWATARAEAEGRTISQFIARLVLAAANVKPTVAPIEPQRAAPRAPAYTPQQLDMRRRALDVSCWQSVEDHVEYLEMAYRSGAITSEEYRNMNNSLDGAEPVI